MNVTSGTSKTINPENLALFLSDNTTLDQYVKAKEEADVSRAQAQEELGALEATKTNIAEREAKLEQRQNECNIALSKIQAERLDLEKVSSETQKGFETQGEALRQRELDLSERAGSLEIRLKKMSTAETDLASRKAQLEAQEQRVSASQADLDERVAAIQRAAR